MSHLDLAVIVVTHNSSDHMPGWLDHVDRLRADTRLEVCLVDSGSSLEDRAYLDREVRPRVEHFILEHNLGYGGACNVGAAATTAPVLLFTNADSHLVSIPPEARSHEQLAGRILGHHIRYNGVYVPDGFVHMPSGRLQLQSLLLGRRSRLFEPAQDAPAYVSGAALLMARRDFERVGGWSEDFFLYFEDADMCHRHRRLGGTVEVSPQLLIDHERDRSGEHRPPGVDHLGRMGVALRSGRMFVRRHQGPLPALVLYLFVLLAYIPRRVLLELWRMAARGLPASEPLSRIVLDSVFPARAARRLRWRSTRSTTSRCGRPTRDRR
jgi:N-acetylglucosaminyl-diphospho-decaprenol L-rhamnosyltransferase